MKPNKKKLTPFQGWVDSQPKSKTFEEIAADLGISRSTLYIWRDAGYIPKLCTAENLIRAKVVTGLNDYELTGRDTKEPKRLPDAVCLVITKGDIN